MENLMKHLFFFFLALLFSCSSPQKTDSKITTRFPASINEFQPYETKIQGEIKIQAKDFLEFNHEEYSFADFVAAAQKHNYKKLVIEPITKSPFKKVSMADESYVSGDLIVLIGTNFSNNDEIIRKGDYDDIYETVRRLSWLKFRTTINLVASVTDLRAALKNQRPTIIMWTSHGNSNYFYDFNQIQVPYSIFAKTSPYIYQFILTSCNGFTAIQNGYKKHIPDTMKYWGWERLVYHPTDVKAHFSDKDWNPYINYPGTLQVEGLVCDKTDNGFAVKHLNSGKFIPGSNRESFERCAYLLTNADKNYVCANENGKWNLFNHSIFASQPGAAFDLNHDCVSRITNAIDGKVCRRLTSDNLFHYIDSNNNISDMSFKGLNECSNYIQSTLEI